MNEIVASFGPKSKLAEATIIAAWQDVSGSQVAQVTESTYVENRRLIVKVNSAPWRQELHLQRRALCERVNRRLGRRAITEIVFR